MHIFATMFQKVNIRLFLLLLLLSCSLLSVRSQNRTASLKGTVLNSQNGDPLPGASIYIPDIRRGTAADSKGKFSLNNIPEGNHLVEISYGGFSSHVESILISDETEKLFQLKPTIAENNEVVVTGVSTATSLKKMTTPVVLMKRQELKH